MIKEERWKKIPGFPNYEVSDAGNARRVGKSKNLKQFGGRITVYRGKNNPIRLHIDEVVSFLFIGKKPDDHIIWHINGNCHDNRVENLKYVPKCYYDMESIEGEEWKDIPGYDGLYQISSKGRARSVFCDRRRCGDKYIKKQQVLKPTITNYGYLVVGLTDKNGKCNSRLVHRLVAEVFIPNPEGLPIINHKDENKVNNSVENLEWCSYSYNNSYNDSAKKRAKKFMRQVCVNKDGKCIMEFESIVATAKYFHVRPTTIHTRLSRGYKSKESGLTFTYK